MITLIRKRLSNIWDYDIQYTTKYGIISIIKELWNSFYKEGVQITIIGYDFSIDTGNENPVCCKNILYG